MCRGSQLHRRIVGQDQDVSRVGLEQRPEARGDAYCYGKVKQDELVMAYGKQFGIPYVIIRPGYVYGPGKKAMSGRVGLWIAGRLNAGMSPVSFRYDQALAATGTLTVGSETFEFNGYGLRGHVRGVRKMAGFASHTWMGAVFPESGRAFGLQCHRGHGTAGGYEFSESYVYQDGTLYPTRIVYAPPISRNDPHAEFDVQLACDELGLVHLTGHDTHVLWTSLGPLGLGTPPEQQPPRTGLVPDAPTAMSQSVASYDWADEPGYGMNERSG